MWAEGGLWLGCWERVRRNKVRMGERDVGEEWMVGVILCLDYSS